MSESEPSFKSGSNQRSIQNDSVNWKHHLNALLLKNCLLFYRRKIYLTAILTIFLSISIFAIRVLVEKRTGSLRCIFNNQSPFNQGCSQHLQFQGGQIYLGGVKSVILNVKFTSSYKIYIKNFALGGAMSVHVPPDHPREHGCF